jgi:hypothetical protein
LSYRFSAAAGDPLLCFPEPVDWFHPGITNR